MNVDRLSLLFHFSLFMINVDHFYIFFYILVGNWRISSHEYVTNISFFSGFVDLLRIGGEPQSKVSGTTFSSCKLNADSIYIRWDLHPISS